MPKNASLVDYYAKRAKEYERIYQKPERQADLATLKELFQKTFAGKDVLEIACGTGYWTEIISRTAKSIIATDVSDEVLQVARAREYGCKVHFQKADAFNLAFPENRFTAGLAAAWWSHLRRFEIPAFLATFHRVFPSGASIAFMDNRFVAGSNTPVSRTDDQGNTYQIRKLDGGTGYEVLKNFPGQKEVEELVRDSAAVTEWTGLAYYWLLTYKLK